MPDGRLNEIDDPFAEKILNHRGVTKSETSLRWLLWCCDMDGWVTVGAKLLGYDFRKFT